MSHAQHRVALLGLAHVHVPDHLAVIEADPGLRLIAVWDGDGLHRKRFPDLARASPAEALAGADLAVVDTPTADHEAVVAVVAERGIPLFVEKPLGRDGSEARRIAELIDRAVVLFATGFFLRCLPALREARELVCTGRLGRLVSADASFGHGGLADGVFAGETAWMLDPARAGVGAFGDLGTHLLDVLRWLRPGVELTVDSAQLSVVPDQALDVAGTAQLAFADGVPCTVRASWVDHPGGLRVRLEGEQASAVVEDGRLTVAGREERSGPPPDARDALRAFVADLRGEPVWERPTTADAVAVAQLVDDVYSLAP